MLSGCEALSTMESWLVLPVMLIASLPAWSAIWAMPVLAVTLTVNVPAVPWISMLPWLGSPGPVGVSGGLPCRFGKMGSPVAPTGSARVPGTGLYLSGSAKLMITEPDAGDASVLMVAK
jgi:hypothetical protein